MPESGMETAIVLLSGGLDSTVALADILTRCRVAGVISFNYGQRAAKPEMDAAQAIARHYSLHHRIVNLPWLAELLPQALTPLQNPLDPDLNPELDLSEEALFDVRRVWVPNRNGLFLNIAACFAEAMQASIVVFGANAEEGASFPDNTAEFREKLNEVLGYSTLTHVRVETPVGNLDKTGIIRRGQELDVPFHLIWSCYEAGETQCGRCPSCLRVKAARDAVNASSGRKSDITFRNG